MSITDLIGQFGRLGETIDKLSSKVESVMNDWEKVAKTVGMTAEELDSSLNEFESLNEELGSINENVKKHEDEYEKLNKKGKKRTLNERKRFDELESERKNRQRKQKKYNENLAKFGGKSPDEVKNLVQQKKQKDVNLREARMKEGGMSKALGKFKGNPWLMVAEMAIKAIEWGIGKMTEYMVVGYENQLRALQAITTRNVNAMKSNLGLWTDSLKGAYEAQNLSMSSNLAMIEAQNATDLANKKLANTWTNWIPIWGAINKYGEEELRLEQQIQETRLKNAMEIIQAGEGYAQKADEYGKKQDDAIRKYTRSVGLSAEQTKIFEKRALGLNASLADINATMEDALKIQMGMQEQGGRLIGFSAEDYKRSTAIGEIMGVENVTKFESEMVIFNKSVADSSSIMEQMYQYANTMGLSQKRLTQNVLNNLKLANKYQFKGGVKGFIDFAKWAENVRFNVAQLGNMIEKIQTGGLEGVIKQSAQLQVLGGGFAMNADPLRMAFNAFQDPESLAKDFYDALKSEGLFDTKTGELTQGIASQMRLRAASEAYGFSYEDARTMIRERTRKENAKSQLRGTNFSESQKDAIANVAQRDENGQWFVNTLKGKKGLGELTKKDLGELLSNNAEEDLVKYAAETLSLTEIISRAAKKVDAILGGETFDNLVETVQQTTSDTVNAFTENMKSVGNAIKSVYDANVKATNEQLSKLATMDIDINEAYAIQQEAKDNIGKIYDLLMEQYGISQEKKDYAQAVADADKLVKETMPDYSNIEYGSQEYKDATNKHIEALYQQELAKEAQRRNNKEHSNTWVGKWWEEWNAGTNKSRAKGLGEMLGLSEEQINQDRKEAREKYKYRPKIESVENEETTPTQDAFASAGGTPMAIAAKDITSIHDGLALADKRDSAVFAKTGGPFDTLFNGIFDRINAVYAALGMDNNTRLGKMMPIAMKTINEMPREMSVGERMREIASNGRRDDSLVKFEPLKVEMSGRLELSSGGKSVDIMTELQNNPLLVREIARMISDSLSSKFYGGKSRMNPGQNTYFK